MKNTNPTSFFLLLILCFMTNAMASPPDEQIDGKHHWKRIDRTIPGTGREEYRYKCTHCGTKTKWSTVQIGGFGFTDTERVYHTSPSSEGCTGIFDEGSDSEDESAKDTDHLPLPTFMRRIHRVYGLILLQ